MEGIVYLNGEFIRAADAKISVFDRGFLFADAVYEVTAVLDGKLVDNASHMARLKRSCQALSLELPVSEETLTAIQKKLIAVNQLQEGEIYLQLSRGNAGVREFSYPAKTKPTLMLFTQQDSLLESPQAQHGIKVISVPDIRWKRRDIKTVGLLAPCMAKQAALEAGADDAWMIEDGFITEGSSNNAYIVTFDGTLITRPLNHDILPGTTRQALLKLAARENLRVEERHFTLEEAYAAKEAFISSATTFVWPVIAIDDHIIGDGTPGPVTQKLRTVYIEVARANMDTGLG